MSGSVEASNVQYPVSDTLYELEELNEDRLTDPNLTWISLSDVTLGYKGTSEYDLAQVEEDQFILVAMDLKPAGSANPPTTEIYQFSVADAAKVPALTFWGQITLGLILLATASVTLALRRKGRMPA